MNFVTSISILSLLVLSAYAQAEELTTVPAAQIETLTNGPTVSAEIAEELTNSPTVPPARAEELTTLPTVPAASNDAGLADSPITEAESVAEASAEAARSEPSIDSMATTLGSHVEVDFQDSHAEATTLHSDVDSSEITMKMMDETTTKSSQTEATSKGSSAEADQARTEQVECYEFTTYMISVAEPELQGAASFWWSQSRNEMRLRQQG
jgi:hypothetical protein